MHSARSLPRVNWKCSSKFEITNDDPALLGNKQVLWSQIAMQHVGCLEEVHAAECIIENAKQVLFCEINLCNLIKEREQGVLNQGHDDKQIVKGFELFLTLGR